MQSLRTTSIVPMNGNKQKWGTYPVGLFVCLFVFLLSWGYQVGRKKKYTALDFFVLFFFSFDMVMSNVMDISTIWPCGARQLEAPSLPRARGGCWLVSEGVSKSSSETANNKSSAAGLKTQSTLKMNGNKQKWGPISVGKKEKYTVGFFLLERLERSWVRRQMHSVVIAVAPLVCYC